jgi:hypothetical protein
VALRLSRTRMSGGLVELPSSETDVNRHFYMLRAADHARPLVNASSSFISPLTDQINKATAGKIAPDFMDLLEKIPASYLVVHNDRLLPGWQAQYEIFLARSLVSGRLRFIKQFDGHDDLYAIVKTEPGAKSEETPQFLSAVHEWSGMIEQDETNILAQPDKCQALYRLELATTGTFPRYAEFIKDAKTIARGVIWESEEEDQTFNKNLREFADKWVRSRSFANSFGQLTEAQFVDKLLANAGIKTDASEEARLIDDLSGGRETRAGTLLEIVNDQRFIDQENNRSLLLLHYFAYLHRNPDDPPDSDLRGFNFWLRELNQYHDVGRITVAFRNSIEYRVIKEHQR